MFHIIRILVAVVLIQASRALGAEINGGSVFITSATNAYPGQFPYQALVLHGLPPIIKYKPLCSGSILNEQWILTSGYCVTVLPKIGKTVVKVGKQELRQDSEYVQTIEVSMRLVHKEYRGIINLIKPNDIGLLKLKRQIRFNERTYPISLPEVNVLPTGLANITGWGTVSSIIIDLPDVLQVAEVPILSKQNCEDALRVAAPADSIGDIQICTGPLDGTTAACFGDSGDPLVQQGNNSVPVQIGITSWAPFPCGTTGSPTVYTLVSAFVYWIQERIEENV